MSNAKHTPGPWFVGGDEDRTVSDYFGDSDTGHFAIYGDDYCIALTIGDVPNVQLREEANARLIAAAPELLAVCEAIFPYIRDVKRDGHEFTEMLRAAIAKAKGE